MKKRIYSKNELIFQNFFVFISEYIVIWVIFEKSLILFYTIHYNYISTSNFFTNKKKTELQKISFKSYN